MSDFPQRLRKLIDSTNQSVNKFSKAIGVSEGTVRNWIGGKGEPDLSDLLKIISETGANIEWLATGNEQKTTSIAVSESQNALELPMSPVLATRIGEALFSVYGATYKAMNEEIKISLFRQLYAGIVLLLGGGEINKPPTVDEIEVMLKLAIKYGKAPAHEAADKTKSPLEAASRAVADASLQQL